MCIIERLLMLIEVIMHLPELFLGGGSFRGLRGMLSMRVALGQRKVPKDKAHPQTSLDLLDDGIGLPTIGTLIIAVFHQGHRGGCWSLLMIALAHRQCKPGRSWFLRH